MKKFLVVLIALVAMIGFTGAVTFEKPHVAKNLTAPSVAAINAANVGMEDSVVSSAIPAVHTTGINTNQYYGGITTAAHGLHAEYGANYVRGEQSGVGTNNGQLSWGYTAWYGNTYPQDGQYFMPALNQLVQLSNSDIHVVNGQAYDAEGHLLEYVPGGANLVDIDGQNPSSNPGLPTGNEDIATTVGDLCTQ
jgi:hypothetical protein